MTHSLPKIKEDLRTLIKDEVFVHLKETGLITYEDYTDSQWMFDFRRVLMRPRTCALLGEVFWETYKKQYPFQICGLEVAAIPLAIGLSQHIYTQENKEDANAFFIRKSRKKTGLLKMIEGTIEKDRPIILVDDLMNTGRSFIRQVEVLEALGHTVRGVWTVLRFRDEAFYTYFHEKNIPLKTLFDLNDFTESVGTKNLSTPNSRPKEQPFEVVWKFSGGKPNYANVMTKSTPALDEKHVYMGTDDGVMWALSKKDGSAVWSKKVLETGSKKGIFSSPVVHEGFVYFGGYDGNVYALNADTGKRAWRFSEADWIGSSPALSEKHNMLYIGLEFGLWKKHGGIAALNASTGKEMWGARFDGLTHSTPLYISEHDEVVIGSNDGAIRLFDAKRGTLKWIFRTGTPTPEELANGFSKYDIKESCAYDSKRDYICVGNTAGSLFVLERKTGKEVFRFDAQFAIVATPTIYKDTVLFSSLDKYVYCLDLKTFTLKWRWYAYARVFAQPVVIEESVYVGGNTGRLSELDPETGKELSSHTLTERITNPIVYNADTKQFFVSTFANELYCLEKKDDQKRRKPGDGDF